jgi:hypothetical protein
MPDELVFSVEGSQASPVEAVSFAEAGLRERQHLQEWVIANPEILGPGVMIITTEFDRWVTGSGQATYERLDVLGLDESGRLVVAELKRDQAPDSVTMQALNYAAMVSRFSLDNLSEVYARQNSESGMTPQDALVKLQEWAPSVSDEIIGSPRIVLLASDFGPTVTNLAMFLYENDLDIRLTRVQPYQTPDGRYLVTVSTILPVPNAEEFMVRPRSGVQTRAASRSSRADWDWTTYESELRISPDRLAVARELVDDIARYIDERSLPWHFKFRKGYVAVQRAGGYNVAAVDVMEQTRSLLDQAAGRARRCAGPRESVSAATRHLGWELPRMGLAHRESHGRARDRARYGHRATVHLMRIPFAGSVKGTYVRTMPYKWM